MSNPEATAARLNRPRNKLGRLPIHFVGLTNATGLCPVLEKNLAKSSRPGLRSNLCALDAKRAGRSRVQKLVTATSSTPPSAMIAAIASTL